MLARDGTWATVGVATTSDIEYHLLWSGSRGIDGCLPRVLTDLDDDEFSRARQRDADSDVHLSLRHKIRGVVGVVALHKEGVRRKRSRQHPRLRHRLKPGSADRVERSPQVRTVRPEDRECRRLGENLIDVPQQ